MSVQLIFFDCDGVLIDSELIACSADAEALTAIGYPITAAEVGRRFAGIPPDTVYQTIEAEMGHPLPPGFDEQVKQTVYEKYRTDLHPIDGAAEVLSSITLPKCIASSSAPAKLTLGLVETGLYRLVYPHIYSASLVRHGKPHPDLFQHTAHAMGADPADCLVIEDSVAGATAAQAAGMECIGFTGGSHCEPGHGDLLRSAGADTIIEDLRDVLAYVS